MGEKVASGRCSPNKIEKSSSSSESSIHFDFDSYIPSELLNQGKPRPSSWDESDGDESVERERSSEGTQLHSSESQKFKASVAAEINELKKQFFESLQKLKNSNYEPLEIEKETMKSKPEDRRQCPARVRRRTKSSSSLSPVLETKSQNSAEKSDGLDEVTSDISDFNPKHYLHDFFNELRTKRISSTVPSFVKVKADEENSECKNQDEEHIPLGDDFTSTDSSDNDANFSKTARKLSQIMEVEENRRDLDKCPEEMSKNSYVFSKNFKKPEKNTSPFQTARSIGETVSKNFKETKQENFKSLSFEEFKEFEDQKPSQGSVSERASKFFRKKPKDNFSFLSVNSPKFRINSPKLFEKKNSKSSKKFNPFNSQSGNDFSQESSSKEDEKENLNSIDCLRIDLTKKLNSENPTPRSSSSSSHSVSNRTTRTRSEKCRHSNPESPKFRINTGRDSVRSLRLEDVSTPDSLKKDTETESKTILFEDRSPKKSRRKMSSSGNSSERKSDRNFQIPLESLSVESLKSSYSKESELNSSKSQKSKSTERSKCKKEKIKKDDFGLEINEPIECYSLLESSRNYEIPISSRVGSPAQEKFKNESQRSRKTGLPSTRSSKSTTPKSTKKLFGHPFEQVTPTPELGLLFDVSESQKSSHRNLKEGESKNCCRSVANSFKCNSRRSSDRSSSSKSTNAARTNTKITPRTNDSLSNRSKESFENTNENPDFEIKAWRESEDANDILSYRTSSEISSRKSPWRVQNTTGPQSCPLRRASNLERNAVNVPENIDFLEEQQSTSGRSSRRSVESMLSGSPTKSMKFSPNPGSSEQLKFPNAHPETEKLYFEAENETISNAISPISPEEGVEETSSSQRLKSESESDRYSEKRLSIINEASIEDLIIDSIEEEGSSRESSRKSSRREQISTKRSSKNTGRSQTEIPKYDDKADSEEWNELIETFRENPDTSFILENAFSGFPYKTETSRNYVRENTHSKSDSKEKKTISKTTVAEHKNEIYFEDETENKNSNLDYKDNSLGKPIKKDIHTLQNFQNLYYFNVNERGSFRIGECGDVRNWNADKSDTPEKPKAYGDGTQLQNTSEVLVLLGKKEKEVKTQRHLWTDLKGEFTSSKQKLQKLFTELEDDIHFKQVISVGLKISKSDNCIIAKNGDENDSKISDCELKNKSKSELGAFGEKISTAKNPTEGDLESLEYENIEFDCGTPRLSRSMIDLNTQLEKENFEDVQLNSNFNSSGSQLFERANVVSKREKESTNLNMFLARNQKEEKTAIKSNNWLHFKALEPEKSYKKNKKTKKKRKDLKSPKENYQEYLYTGKCRSSVPPLKLRNSSCLQNFYKRIIHINLMSRTSSRITAHKRKQLKICYHIMLYENYEKSQ